jgi:phosphate transport system substrate-binding protein
MKLKALYIGAIIATMFSCGGSETPAEGSDSTANAEGTESSISIDGSSTVYPITAGIAEMFGEESEVEVTVGESGTGGGFKKFASGEIAICDASRSIKDGEAADCEKNGIKYQEIKIAYDGLAIVVNKENTFIDKLTVEELKKIWIADKPAMTWADVRAGWPKEKIVLYGPGDASGTYDYFKEAILGKEVAMRTDFNPNENDNALVKGVADGKFALAYFGLSYYEQNKDKLKIVPIDGGKGAITPTLATVLDKTYSPLSRPLFIYVSNKGVANAGVKSFVDFYLKTVNETSKRVGYIPLPDAELAEQVKIFQAFAEKK